MVLFVGLILFDESWCHNEVVEWRYDFVHWHCQVADARNHGQPLSPVGLKLDAVGGKPSLVDVTGSRILKKLGPHLSFTRRPRRLHSALRFNRIRRCQTMKGKGKRVGLYERLGKLVQSFECMGVRSSNNQRHICGTQSSDISSSLRIDEVERIRRGLGTVSVQNTERPNVEACNRLPYLWLNLSPCLTRNSLLYDQGGKFNEWVLLIYPFGLPLTPRSVYFLNMQSKTNNGSVFVLFLCARWPCLNEKMKQTALLWAGALVFFHSKWEH